MSEEIKVRINNYRAIEKKLVNLGGKYTGEIYVIDTYFNQPKGILLKITEDDRGNFLVHIKRKYGKFRIIKREEINNVVSQKEKLKNKFGIICIIRKKRRFFNFNNYMININLIEDLGEFLIVEGNNLNKDIIINKLGIKNPEYITVSFDKLI